MDTKEHYYGQKFLVFLSISVVWGSLGFLLWQDPNRLPILMLIGVGGIILVLLWIVASSIVDYWHAKREMKRIETMARDTVEKYRKAKND